MYLYIYILMPIEKLCLFIFVAIAATDGNSMGASGDNDSKDSHANAEKDWFHEDMDSSHYHHADDYEDDFDSDNDFDESYSSRGKRKRGSRPRRSNATVDGTPKRGRKGGGTFISLVMLIVYKYLNLTDYYFPLIQVIDVVMQPMETQQIGEDVVVQAIMLTLRLQQLRLPRLLRMQQALRPLQQQVDSMQRTPTQHHQYRLSTKPHSQLWY